MAVIVSNVVIQRVIRPGIDSGATKNDSHDTIMKRAEGKYV